ncbi:MAG TPA: hypothetical protein VHL78_05745 [Actinomycetota bacterium]|nr:hypothetical protein [Actinomycetota bacterium]
MPVHSHGDVSHDHGDAAPGHTHDRVAAAPDTVPAVVDVGPTAGGLALRVLLTLLGAAAMILGAFLTWLARGDTSAAGTEIDWRVLFFGDLARAGLLRSAGLVVIVIALLAVLGLALRRGWLTVLAGVLGIVAFAVMVIQEYRADGAIGNVRVGLWVVLAGAVAALIGGFFASRSRVVATTRPA